MRLKRRGFAGVPPDTYAITPVRLVNGVTDNTGTSVQQPRKRDTRAMASIDVPYTVILDGKRYLSRIQVTKGNLVWRYDIILSSTQFRLGEWDRIAPFNEMASDYEMNDSVVIFADWHGLMVDTYEPYGDSIFDKRGMHEQPVTERLIVGCTVDTSDATPKRLRQIPHIKEDCVAQQMLLGMAQITCESIIKLVVGGQDDTGKKD